MKSHEHRLEDERDSARRLQDGPVEADAAPLERLAANVGNQAFGVLAREGAGIMADGTAHPDVQAAIARRRGGGAPLDPGLRQQVAPQLGDSLADVRVHTDSEAGGLTQAVSARAFTTGADIYFAPGEYSPGSQSGQQLLAHELTHVVQQRGAPTAGPMVVSQPGDALEREADSVSRELT
jgi:hypothetical protein